MNLKTFERLLPPSPPLAGRWHVYRCTCCTERTTVDLRIFRLPLVQKLKKSGLARVHCSSCGGTDVVMDGLMVS
jgi:hypothetical protein